MEYFGFFDVRSESPMPYAKLSVPQATQKRRHNLNLERPTHSPTLGRHYEVQYPPNACPIAAHLPIVRLHFTTARIPTFSHRYCSHQSTLHSATTICKAKCYIPGGAEKAILDWP